MRDTRGLATFEKIPAMSLCVGMCQMDEFGYCIGCGRTQAEIDGGEPSAAETGSEPPAAKHASPPAPADAH